MVHRDPLRIAGRLVAFETSQERHERHPALVPPAGDGWEDPFAIASSWTASGVAPTINESTGVVTIELRIKGASAVAARLERVAGERFWGFGVRSDAVERTDGVVENWVGEGPYQLGEYPLIEAITPRWAIRRRPDAAYYPVPWAMSSAGLAVLIDNAELSLFRIDRKFGVEVLADTLKLRLFTGGSPFELLRRFTEATGRQPHPSAPWFFGPWVQTGHADLVPLEEERRIVDTLLEAGVPLGAVETQMRRLPAGAHEGRRDAERARTAMFHERGLRSLTYLNPFVSEEYTRRFEAASPMLHRRADGSPYLYAAYAGGRVPPVTTEGQLDFGRPEAVAFFAELAREAIEDGHDGWMEDFGEYTPPDAQAEHNSYPVQFHAAGAQAAAATAGGKPIARFVRSGWTGAAPHAPLVWGGDPTTGWGFDGLASALTQGLSAGLSGIAFWGSDIGGFFTLGDEVLDAELLIRWIQLGALSPLMRTKAEGIAIPPRRRPQVWDADILPHWRRWATFHAALLPYLLHAAREYVETGMPLMRHMCLVDQACERHDQYLLGPDLLVAPVLAPDVSERDVYVPAGSWVDAYRSTAHEGPATITVPAPVGEIPMLMRSGARGNLPEP